MQRAGRDEKKVEEISATSDDDLLKRWLWKFSLIGAPICFFILPIVMSFVGALISVIITEVLWLVVKAAMGVVLLALIFAIVMTVTKPDNQD